MGKGYGQKKRHACKMNNQGQYGGHIINVPKLMNEMILEARRGGETVYED